MKCLFVWLLTILPAVQLEAAPTQLVSPNGKLSVNIKGDRAAITFQNTSVLEWQTTLPASQWKAGKAKKVKADYQMLAGKRSHCTNEANEYRIALGSTQQMVLRVYNDGLAFRYEYPSLSDGKAPEEKTAYLIPEGTRRWIQQWTDGYEGFFPLTTSYKTKAERSFNRPSLSPEGYNNRWGYPALLEPADGVFALITEANIERGQSASCLYSDGETYRVVQDEKLPGKDCDHTPWRVVIVGTLADIVQSTLVTDVSEPAKTGDTSWIQPGVVSWVYWAYNHGSNDYNIIKKYVDMAVALKLPYVLIDAEWDEMKDGKTVEDAVAYAKQNGVKPMIWYNSSVGWIDGAPGPKFRLNKPEDREKEFAWCERIGVAGVKIDFFSGDNQKNMDYCIDLLESAARHHLLANFHGATIPRGWQRTYPNLLSTEGVYGAEWYNNVPTFTKKAASHNATLPFTRNVIGPMDYTPCAFSDSQHPHITSHAHELALTVLFESGLQHLADRPESFLAQPDQVKGFLSRLPAAWDDTKFLGGYPGKYAVIARRHGNTWYVAGINGTDEAMDIPLDAAFAGQAKGNACVFEDSGAPEKPWKITQSVALPASFMCQPRGGFVFFFENETN